MVKNALADYSVDQFEIASYTSLLAAVCQQILRDEEVMAQFLAQQIPAITQEYLGMRSREHGVA